MPHVILVQFTDEIVLGLEHDDEEGLWVAPDMDAAIAMSKKHPLCQSRPYLIVDLAYMTQP